MLHAAAYGSIARMQTITISDQSLRRHRVSGYLEDQFGLKGKKAVVTGAGRGIGRAIAEALAGAGAEVLVHYNQSAEAAGEVVSNITAAGGSAWSAGADLTDSVQ